MKDRQPCSFRPLPITYRIIANVQYLVRREPAQLQGAVVNQWIGLVRAEFAGEKHVRKEFRDAELFQNHAQAAIEV